MTNTELLEHAKVLVKDPVFMAMFAEEMQKMSEELEKEDERRVVTAADLERSYSI